MSFHLPDLINACFEFWGGVAIWGNALQLYRDKAYKGVRLDSTVFFTAWGFWNVYYYPHLDQALSFAAGLFIVAGNCAWLSLMLRYRRRVAADRGPCLWPDCSGQCGVGPCDPYIKG
jgi:hypothetical protein